MAKGQRRINNADIIAYNEELAELSEFEIDPKDVNSLELVKGRCQDYHLICKKYDITPMLEGLAVTFGVQRKDLLDWANGKGDWDVPVVKFFQTELSFLTSCMMTATAEGNLDKVSMIYLSKNNYEYVNEDQAPRGFSINVQLSPEQLIEEARNLQITKKSGKSGD